MGHLFHLAHVFISVLRLQPEQTHRPPIVSVGRVCIGRNKQIDSCRPPCISQKPYSTTLTSSALLTSWAHCAIRMSALSPAHPDKNCRVRCVCSKPSPKTLENPGQNTIDASKRRRSGGAAGHHCRELSVRNLPRAKNDGPSTRPVL